MRGLERNLGDSSIYFAPDQSTGGSNLLPDKARSFKSETTQFLQTFRQSNEFYYNGNLGLVGNLSNLTEAGKRDALWSRAFVDRLFNIGTLAGAEVLLEPWLRWDAVHSQIWAEYDSDLGGKTEAARHKECDDQFAQVEIPAEIRQYQGNLHDSELRSLAHWEIFKLTREVREAIDLIEGTVKPISLETIFRVQRIMGKPFMPVGGLEDSVRNKPGAIRVVHGGKNYIAFEEEQAAYGSEDPASEEKWQRWNQLAVGTKVSYLKGDSHGKKKTIEVGTVQGFDLLGAGEAMLFCPSVANIGVIVTNNQTGFFECPLVSDIRLDQGQIKPEELSAVESPKPVDVVFMEPQKGKITRQTFATMEQATTEVKRRITRKVKSRGKD